MTYKSTTFKTKINVDSTLMKYLNLQPTFLAPPQLNLSLDGLCRGPLKSKLKFMVGETKK